MSEAGEANKVDRGAGYRPAEPIQDGPLYQRPLRVKAVARWLFGFPGFFWPWNALFFGVALVSWLYLTRDMAGMKSLSASWIVLLFARNLILLTVFTSAWHLWLYAWRKQGIDYKYSNKWLATDAPKFLFRNQLWDNVFWVMVSAVPMWTGYEVLTFWLQANGFAPTVSWQTHPVYCTLLLLLAPTWMNVHFYTTHRLIHWEPLYRSVHYLHHKNVNVGPWSGLAMHPVEHLVYFSAVILFWFIPSHPLHAVFVLVSFAFGPTVTHHGFGKLVLRQNKTFNTDHYMHYLHHKYFTVNYSTDNAILPLDKWLGTFHDGSDAATEAFKRRMREKALRSRNPIKRDTP